MKRKNKVYFFLCKLHIIVFNRLTMRTQRRFCYQLHWLTHLLCYGKFPLTLQLLISLIKGLERKILNKEIRKIGTICEKFYI